MEHVVNFSIDFFHLLSFRTFNTVRQRLFVVQSKAQDTFIFFYLRKPLHKKTPQIEKNRSDTPYRFDS